ncbi:WXG100 family type VII secretion target [Nocardia arthritidis]|uniref:WXG100 family type VII secretion target n=1 Tax=Nocardia arthritidis TaxID=228602 RepID=A0A6G9YI70_9NOCA|nr:WXG100 family type VII secretion target [Nocardia arthritidis]QIS12643.1 hypothetical protein F5544_23930 [Nocardia arthritidis]
MTSLDVDPEALRRTSSRFDDAASTVAAALTKLRQTLDAGGECWGTDAAGQAFAKNYEQAAEAGLKSIDGLAGVFTKLGAAVVKVADGMQSRDAVNAAATNGLAT